MKYKIFRLFSWSIKSLVISNPIKCLNQWIQINWIKTKYSIKNYEIIIFLTIFGYFDFWKYIFIFPLFITWCEPDFEHFLMSQALQMNSNLWKIVYHLYYNIQKCLFVFGYRLGFWKRSSLNIGIIKTSRTWGYAKWKEFSRKVTSGQITEEKCYATSTFLWQIFYIYFSLSFWTGPRLLLCIIYKLESARSMNAKI